MKNRLPIALSATALVVSLLGATGIGQAASNAVVSSFASNAGKLGGYAPSKTAKKNTVVVRGSNGKIDKASLPLTRGPAGPTGPTGPKGDTGATGAAGAKGDTGASFTLATTLPSGQTETGGWAVGGGTSDYLSDSINFRIPLAAPITGANAHYLAVGAPTTAACPGPGQAASGQLCIYGFENGGTKTFSSVYNNEGGSNAGAGKNGFFIYFSGTSNLAYESGTWAVTAP
jgi:hypothetical protein